MTPPEEVNVIDLIKAGQYIQAIKLRREQTGESLKEAKEYVDQLRLGHEMKVLKCTSIDEMRARISEMISINESQRNFLLDVIDEAYYLGEDNGNQVGYMKALEENSTGRNDEEWEEEVYNNGYDDGRRDAYQEGYDVGYEEGGEETYESAWSEGFAEGKTAGYDMGKNDGYEEGQEVGYDEGYIAAMEERND